MNLPDFDQLLELAKNQPKELERLRSTLIHSLIEQAEGDTKKRLRGLQFQIDAQRQIHKNPLGACVKISSMMTDSFHDLIAQLNQSRVEQKTMSAKIYKLDMAESER